MNSERSSRRAATHQQLVTLRWGCLWMDGHQLSYNDSKRMYYAYMLWITLLSDVQYQAQYVLREHKRVSKGIFDVAYQKVSRASRNISMSTLTRDDVKTVMSDLKAALLVLRHIPTKECRYSFANSSSVVKVLNKQYGGSGKTAIWGAIKPFLIATIMTQDPDLFRLTNDLCQYIVRVTLEDVDWIEEDAHVAYKEMEITLQQQEYDPEVVTEVRNVVTEWFRDFDSNLNDYVDRLQAEHGYGATAEVHRSEGTAAKYHSMVMTPEAYYLAKKFKWDPLDHIWPGLTRQSYLSHHRDRRGDPTVLHSSELVGQVQFVPKGTDKKRTVSKEPTVNQFFQKKIGMVLSDHFDRHPEMRIDLHDQDKNRKLCLKGSIDGSYSTIDLSNASDSVTLTIVREITRDVPGLYRLLMWARTNQVQLPDGDIIALEKFAPMGAGDCFPVECFTFSAIITAVMKRHGVHCYYRVYGDDLVVPQKYYDEVIQTLKQLHFQPNDDKSYGHGSLFTESCGIECFRGTDVSPIRLSRKWDEVAAQERNTLDVRQPRLSVTVLSQLYRTFVQLLRTNVQLSRYYLNNLQVMWERTLDKAEKKRNIGVTQLSSYYKLANDAYDRAFMHLRNALICLASKSFDAPIYSHNHVMGFFTPGNLPYTLGENCFFDEDTQEYYCVVNALRVKTRPGEDDLRYSKVLEALSTTRRAALLDPEDLVTADCGSAITKLCTVIVPYRDLVSYDCDLINHSS